MSRWMKLITLLSVSLTFIAFTGFVFQLGKNSNTVKPVNSIAVVSGIDAKYVLSSVEWVHLADKDRYSLYLCHDKSGKNFKLLIAPGEEVLNIVYAILHNEYDFANNYSEVGLWDGTKIVWRKKHMIE